MAEVHVEFRTPDAQIIEIVDRFIVLFGKFFKIDRKVRSCR